MIPSERISIVILAHNKVEITDQCLQSLARAVSGLNHEVILLDNGSDQNLGSLRKFESDFRSFRIIRSEENLSFSIANNRCVEASSGQWLLFLNNDVFLRENSIHQLMAPMLTDSSIAATGGKLLFPGESSVQHAGINQMLWDHPSNYGVGASPDDSRISDRRNCFALSGAMLLVNRAVFQTIGGFDERYIWGTEDIDLCVRIRMSGRNVLYCPDSVAIHFESATLKGSNRCKSESNCRLFRRLWDSILVPREQKYVEWMKSKRIRRVAVFGMGTAARGMTKILDKNGIDIVAFTSSDPNPADELFLCRPILPLASLKATAYDRLMVASQYFFAVEPTIREHDPLHEPLYPSLN
jgi:GT2 family glycosyltransferase